MKFNLTTFLIGILLSTNLLAQSYNRINQPTLINSTLKVGSSTANTTSAQMEVVTTSKGSIACPKMTLAQMASVASPTAGLCVYATDATKNKAKVYDGSAWNSIISNPGTDNISVSTNTISTTNTNGDLNLSPNGSGTVVVNTDFETDNINLNGNTVSSIDTNGDLNLEPNGSGMVKSTKNVALSSTLAIGQTTAAQTAAALEVVSTTKGSIPCPKMTTAQRNSVASPTSGLCIHNTTSDKLNVYSNGAWTDVGSGAGGLPTIITNGDFELGSSNWTASGGSFATTTSSPMIGTTHATWDSSSASQTLSNDSVTIPPGYYATNGEAFCYFKTPSGTATHKLQVYDGTNVLAEQTIVSTTNASKVLVNFSFPTSGSLVLRIISVASDEPSISIDGCYMGPAFNLGAASIIGEWQAYTPTLSNFGSTTNVSFFYRRVGGSLEIRGYFTTGTVVASLASMTLPSGLALDSARISVANTTGNPGESVGIYNTSAVDQIGSMVTATGTSTSLLYFGSNNATAAKLTPTTANTISSTTAVSIFASVPISGWAGVSNTYTTDQSDYGPTSFTPTGSWSSNTTYSGYHWRVGNMLHMEVKVATSGAPTSADLTINLPTGLTMDTSKMLFDGASENKNIRGSSAVFYDAGTVTYGSVGYSSSSAVKVYAMLDDGGTGSNWVVANVVNASNPMTWASGDSAIIYVQVPISGWATTNRAPQLVNSVVTDYAGVIRVASARISSTGVVSNEIGDFINGNCVMSGGSSNLGTCTLNTGFWTGTPNCVATTTDGTGAGGGAVIESLAASTTQISYTGVDGGSNAANPLTLWCMGAK